MSRTQFSPWAYGSSRLPTDRGKPSAPWLSAAYHSASKKPRSPHFGFTVDAESQMGRARITNEEIAAAANSDIMIAFGSIDPHKGKMGGREARRLVESHGVKGFKFHPTVQGFLPADKIIAQAPVYFASFATQTWLTGL